MVTQHRIILVNHSRLMRDLLEKVISKSPGLEIVANVEDISELPYVLEQIEANWGIIILPPNGRVPDLVYQIVKEQGRMHFLLMDVDGSHVRMMYSEPYQVSLDNKSLPDLLNLLHQDQFERIKV